MSAIAKPSPIPVRPSSFIDTLKIENGPRGPLGRYFLALEHCFYERGYSLSFATFEDLRTLFLENQDSWPSLPPFMDHTEVSIPADTSVVFFCHDQNGHVAATGAARLLDFSGTTLRREAEGLRLIYQDRADEMSDYMKCTCSAPGGEIISGPTLYNGAFWISPEHRRGGISRIMSRLARFYGVARWGFSYDFSIASKKLMRPDVQALYGYEFHEPSFVVEREGALLMDGVLMWSTIQYILSDIEPETEILTDLGRTDRKRSTKQLLAAIAQSNRR